MDDIADAAGLEPVLYQHFRGRLNLYLALLDISCDRLVEVVRLRTNINANTSGSRPLGLFK